MYCFECQSFVCCVALHCVALRCVALRCVALRCIALHCTSHLYALVVVCPQLTTTCSTMQAELEEQLIAAARTGNCQARLNSQSPPP